MEFWGVEVKPGKQFKVKPEEDTLIHISQATLGDCRKMKGESASLYVKVGEQKFVLGTLLSESIPQISFDMVFEKEFELSHNWGKGSVYFVGYKSPNVEDLEGGDYFSDSEEEEEEEVPATITANGNAAKTIAKPKATLAVKDESDSEDGMGDEDDEDSEEEEETPKKPESSKKRANEAAPKTPVSGKKAKIAVTPQKTEEKKKGGHTATPHPAKKGGKTPTTATQQSPKSAAGQVSCGSCKKTFNSSNALESHNKAKHAAK